MLGPERPFAQHLRTVMSNRTLEGSSVSDLKAAVTAIRLALLDVEDAIAELECLAPQDAIQRGDRIHGVGGHAIPEVDPRIYRVEELRTECEQMLRRPLNGLERGIVMSWADLERDGEPVPVAEILDLTRHLLSRPTPDGTLPSTLKWCEATVQTLARAPVAALRGRGGRNQAAELASLYGEMADRLESEERNSR